MVQIGESALNIIKTIAGTVMDCGVFVPVLAFVKLFEDEGVKVTRDEVRAPMGVHKKVCMVFIY